MKKLLPFLILVIGIFSCDDTKDKKTDDSVVITTPVIDNPYDSIYIIPEPPCSLIPDGREVPLMRPRKPRVITQPTPTPVPTIPTPTPVPSPNVTSCLYFDFDGEVVQDAGWNGGQRFSCAPAGIGPDEIAIMMERVQLAYAPYNITVTTNVDVYNSAAVKQRIVVTQTSGWYPQGVSGIAKIGSLGSGSPAFVFADRLGSNAQYVSAIMVHESGHTVGLRHQGQYGTACSLLQTYKPGVSMGNSLYQWNDVWDSQSCSNQDDAAVLRSRLGLRS